MDVKRYKELTQLATYFNNKASVHYGGHIFTALKNRDEVLLPSDVEFILIQVLGRKPTFEELDQADWMSLDNQLKEVFG